MSEIRVAQDIADYGITLDWLLTPAGGLDTSNELATAVIVALGTDRIADPSDVLPTDSTDRRGWWGDMDAETIWGGWPIGCRLWLLEREAIRDETFKDGSTLGRAEAYIREAVRPFIDAGVASHITVDVEQNGRGRIDALVRLFRGAGEFIDLRFSDLWKDIEA